MANTERVQAVLNWNYFRERDALQVRRYALQDPEIGSDRKAITEAFIALGEKIDTGWRPSEAPKTVDLNAAAAEQLQQAADIMAAVKDLLSGMDVTALRQVEGFNEQAYNRLSQGIEGAAAAMLSEPEFFDEDDDY